MHTVVGIVGYYPFLRGYPLGPALMEGLRTPAWAAALDVREMNWGPIAIVQELQSQPRKPDRVVLVGAVDRGLPADRISCRRWAGGALDPLAVQRRVFEAVTGVIHLDNLVVIGAHFGVWPPALLTVEWQSADSDVGDLVLGEIEGARLSGSIGVVGDRPLTAANRRVVEQLVEAVRHAALDDAWPAAQPLTVDQLTPAAPVCQHRFFDEPMP